jgi:hypothetical protein
VRPIIEDMLKQIKEPVVARGTDDPHFTMVSIQGKKKDEFGRPVWNEHISIIDWCNRYHNPETTEFNNLEDTKVVPAEIVLRFRKRSASSVPEVYTRAPVAMKRATGRIRVVDDDDEDDDEDDGRYRPQPPAETKRRAYRPPK